MKALAHHQGFLFVDYFDMVPLPMLSNVLIGRHVGEGFKLDMGKSKKRN